MSKYLTVNNQMFDTDVELYSIKCLQNSQVNYNSSGKNAFSGS